MGGLGIKNADPVYTLLVYMHLRSLPKCSRPEASAGRPQHVPMCTTGRFCTSIIDGLTTVYFAMHSV